MSDSIVARLRAANVRGRVVAPGDDAYEQSRKVWNGVADRRPGAIFYAESVDDVRRGVEAAAGERLAVRAGGHSLPGLSTCDDGLILDLSLLNAVTADPATMRAEAGGGALLGDVDRATVPHGYVVPAGIVSHTGVGGLTLGGGMGWSSRRHGLTIDSLTAVEMVTADGTILKVDADSNPELFWGIRGGGGNFGIVTRFSFALRPLGKMAVGQWSYPLGEATAAIARLRDLARTRPREFAVAFTLSRQDIGLTATWFGDEALAEPMLSPLGALAGRGKGGLTKMSFLELQSRNDSHFAWSRRYYAKGGFWSDIDDKAIGHIVADIADAPTDHCEIYVTQLGGAIGDVADDATAYSGRDAGYYWIVEPVWDRPEDDEKCLAWGRASAGRLATLSMAGNYVNEQADAGAEIARSAYGAVKYERLRRLKTRLDPNNLFRLNQNIEPLSAKVAG